MQYPHVEFVMLAVAQDQGLHKYPLAISEIEFEETLEVIERHFAAFTSSQLIDLATGDQEEWSGIYKAAGVRGSAKELTHTALDSIFESVVL